MPVSGAAYAGAGFLFQPEADKCVSLMASSFRQNVFLLRSSVFEIISQTECNGQPAVIAGLLNKARSLAYVYKIPKIPKSEI